MPMKIKIRVPGGACRECGCTDNRACPGGCSWVAPDLCTQCLWSLVALSEREVKTLARLTEGLATKWAVWTTAEDFEVAVRLRAVWRRLLPSTRKKAKRSRK